jgi:hypothetical protein
VTVEIISQHHKKILGITINHFSSSESHERHGSIRLFLSLVALIVVFQLCKTWMQRPAPWGCSSHRRWWRRRAAPPCCLAKSFGDTPRVQGVRDLELILHSDGVSSSSSSMVQGMCDLELVLHSDGVTSSSSSTVQGVRDPELGQAGGTISMTR